MVMISFVALCSLLSFTRGIDFADLCDIDESRLSDALCFSVAP